MTTNPDSRRRRGGDGRYIGKASEEVTERICLGIRAGVSLETAAAWAEIDESTITRWKQRVAAGNGTKAERAFVAAVTQAVADFKVTIAARITSPDTPRHVLMEFLGRRFPAEFGPVQRVAVDQHVAGTVEHDHLHRVVTDWTVYSDEELEQLKTLLEKGLQATEGRKGELLQLPAWRR